VSRLAALTGVTGFLGSHVAEALASRGWRLRVLARGAIRLPDLGTTPVEVVPGHLREPGALAALVRGADAVVHMAGLVKARDAAAFMAANADGAAAMARTWREHAPDARFVMVSSMAARAPRLSAYAASKRAGEEAVREAFPDGDWQILRPCAIYGPRDRETLLMFRAAGAGLTPLLNGARARLCLIHVSDAAQAVACALEGGARHGVHEVSDARREGYGWDAIGETAARAMGRAWRPVRIPAGVLRLVGLAGDVASLAGVGAGMVTSGKVREILHEDWGSDDVRQLSADLWRPLIGLDEGFDATAGWYRKAGWV